MLRTALHRHSRLMNKGRLGVRISVTYYLLPVQPEDAFEDTAFRLGFEIVKF
jgi:hypothetical protein